MPRHDYHCPECGWTLRDQYRSISVGAQADPPVCFNCDLPMEWIPQISRMDAFEPGQEFVVYDGQNRPVQVESFAQMRRLEAASEQQFRNGEGQPLRFRALHQDRSNMDRNTYGEAPAPTIDAAAKRKWGLQGATRKIDGSEGEPSVSYGPGVHDGNTSALDALKGGGS